MDQDFFREMKKGHLNVVVLVICAVPIVQFSLLYIVINQIRH